MQNQRMHRKLIDRYVFGIEPTVVTTKREAYQEKLKSLQRKNETNCQDEVEGVSQISQNDAEDNKSGTFKAENKYVHDSSNVDGKIEDEVNLFSKIEHGNFVNKEGQSKNIETLEGFSNLIDELESNGNSAWEDEIFGNTSTSDIDYDKGFDKND